MTQLLAALRAIAQALDDLQQRWALIGGLAVSARSEPRFTKDIDLAVAVSDDRQAEHLIRALTQRGFSVLALVEQEAVGRLATVRLSPPEESGMGIVVDLLFASSGIEPELVAAADRYEIADGVAVPVAKTGHLLALKLLARDDARRPQDAVDVRALFRETDAVEMVRAQEAIRQIEARGFHRGRDLRAQLQAAREHFGYTDAGQP